MIRIPGNLVFSFSTVSLCPSYTTCPLLVSMSLTPALIRIYFDEGISLLSRNWLTSLMFPEGELVKFHFFNFWLGTRLVVRGINVDHDSRLRYLANKSYLGDRYLANKSYLGDRYLANKSYLGLDT